MLVDEEEAYKPAEGEKTAAAAKTRANQPAIELAIAVASGQCSSRSVDGSDDGSVAVAAASADALIGLPLTLCVFVIHLTDQTQTHCQS